MFDSIYTIVTRWETSINMTESFQIYQKHKKKDNKNIRSEHEQFIFVYRVYKIYAAKKNEYVYPWEKLLRDWRLKDNTRKEVSLRD